MLRFYWALHSFAPPACKHCRAVERLPFPLSFPPPRDDEHTHRGGRPLLLVEDAGEVSPARAPPPPARPPRRSRRPRSSGSAECALRLACATQRAESCRPASGSGAHAPLRAPTSAHARERVRAERLRRRAVQRVVRRRDGVRERVAQLRHPRLARGADSCVLST